MLTLLLGDDIFAKQAFLDAQLVKTGGELIKYESGAQMPKLSQLGGANLFGGEAVHLFLGALKEYELEDLRQAVESSAQIYFWEDSLDKRLTKTKELLKIAEVKEFVAPTKEQASQWILAHAEQMGVNIQPSAANELAKRLLGDTKTVLPVAMAHQELFKLSSYAGEESITVAMVEELTPQDQNIDLFALLDFIGNKNKVQAIKLLQNYYDSATEDDKVLTIRLVALVSDQFRSLLITKQLSSQGFTDQQILQATGWKSGRLFVMKKIGRNFTDTQLSAALSKLYNLDKELKSSTLPPRAVVDLIVATI